MSGVGGLGIGSGLDLNNLVSSLLRAERAPAENRIQRGEQHAELQLSALGQLQESLGGFLGTLRELEDLEVGRQVASSQEAVVSGEADSTLAPGSYEISVQQLASAQSWASDAFDDLEQPLGEGMLHVTQGEETVEIALGEEAATLAELPAALQDSGLDVQASVVRDGEAYRLLLTAGQTGSSGAVSLEVSGGVDARLASENMEETAPAADAQFRVNGLALSASSNVVDDVVPGLEMTLKQETEGNESITLEVSQDRDELRGRLESMVESYNALVGSIETLGRADPEGGESGPLVGDSILRQIQMHLGGAFTTPIEADAEAPSTGMMLDLGLSVDVEGRASLDTATLEEALLKDEGAVAALVSGFAERFSGVLQGYSGSQGAIRLREEGLNERLEGLDRQRDELDTRMERVEERLRAQFMALDATVTQFQRTSDYLSQQLTNLANPSNS